MENGLVTPDPAFLRRAMKTLNQRYQASKQVVESIRPDIERYRAMYDCVTSSKEHRWEANLVIPKARYIIDTITPQIVSTIFSRERWLTTKNINIPEESLALMDKWLVWFCDRYMDWYLQALQIFKSSPIDGTSIAKLFMRNGLPALMYDDILNFYPDPACHIPGNVDAMEYCFHRVHRTFSQLEQATVPMLQNVGVGSMALPALMDVPMYTNLDKLWNLYRPTETINLDGETVEQYRPPYELMEYYGNIETTFGVYDTDRSRYKPGKYDEYVITVLKEGLESENADLVLRAQNSTFAYMDSISGRVMYLKPFITSLYSIEPGSFYGTSALKPVESLIAELTDFHNLFLDNMKRSVLTILKVLKNSGLDEDDLECKPMGIWYVRGHDDVMPVDFPPVQLAGLGAIDQMLGQEIDRLSTPQSMQGVPVSKRQTGLEFQSLLQQGSQRFATFIQSADRLTLRPFVQKVRIFLSKLPAIVEGRAFQTPFGEVMLNPKWLTDASDVSFAATGVEPEQSLYMKRELFPQILTALSNMMTQSGGQYKINLPEIVKLLEPIYDFKGVGRLVEPTSNYVSINALATVLQTAMQSNPQFVQMAPVMAQFVEMAQQLDKQAMGGESPPLSGMVAQMSGQMQQQVQQQVGEGEQNAAQSAY